MVKVIAFLGGTLPYCGNTPVHIFTLCVSASVSVIACIVQGRVLYDVILYHHGDDNGGVLLECDSQATQDVIKHLRRYALRSKVLHYVTHFCCCCCCLLLFLLLLLLL